MSSKSGLDNLEGSVRTGGDILKTLSANEFGRVADNTDKLLSSMLVTPLDPAPTSDDPELSASSSLLDRLLWLLALLFLSFPPADPTPDELLPPASLPSVSGVSKSKPYCSKDRLKDVPFSE
jgi:hypothetical protein